MCGECAGVCVRQCGHEALLIRNVYVQMIVVYGRGARATQLGDDLYQVLAAQQEVTFGSPGRTLNGKVNT